MVIRPARQGDQPAIAKIMEVCELITDGVMYDRWDGIVLVAERQAEVVGFLACLPAKPYAVVTEMGVLPEHRKGRAAGRLLESCDLLLRSLGVTHWMCYVGEKRMDAHEGLRKIAKETGSGSAYVRTL